MTLGAGCHRCWRSSPHTWRAIFVACRVLSCSASTSWPKTEPAALHVDADSLVDGSASAIVGAPLRVTGEGLSTIWFVNRNASNPFNASISTACIIMPYLWGTDFGEVKDPASIPYPRRAAQQPTPAVTGNINGDANERLVARDGVVPLGSHSLGATDKIHVPAVVVNDTHLMCNPPEISAPGPGKLQLWPQGGSQLWNISYYYLWDVAIGLRPYIGETEASLLLRVDRHSTLAAGQLLHVTASLPFGDHKWQWTVQPGPEEHVLPFDISALPQAVNNDMEITITTVSSSLHLKNLTATKYKRFMRAPVPPTDVGAVQVDASTQGLRVSGQPWNGNGYFMWSDFMNTTNLREFAALMPGLVESGFNLVFMYGLNGVGRPLWNSSYETQLEFLDNCSAAGMKVIYPPDWGAINPMGGHGSYGSCTHHRACANETLLADLKGNISKVMSHPAILGYYICDDCCDDQPDISAMSQIYNILKSFDPYHLVAGAVNCDDVWTFNEVPSIAIPPELNATRVPVIPLGVQPRLQLALDFPMVENYGGEPFFQYSGVYPEAQSRDGDLRHGNSFSVVVNMEAPESYVNFTGASYAQTHKPSTLRGEQAATTKAWLGAITANIISTIDWCLNTWGVNHFPQGLSPLTIPAARFGHQTQALLHILQSPFGGVKQPTVVLSSASWHGPDDSINPGAIKARAWRANTTSSVVCALVAMVNTFDCYNATTTPRPPLVPCSRFEPNSTYPGFIEFTARLIDIPQLQTRQTNGKFASVADRVSSEASLKRIYAYTSDGQPRSNYSVDVSSTAEFADRIGAGETNLYLLEQPVGSCMAT